MQASSTRPRSKIFPLIGGMRSLRSICRRISTPFVPLFLKCGLATGAASSILPPPMALVASVEKAAYVAAKHGVLGLTKVVALETATTNITCNAICPGRVLTPLMEKQIKERASRENISVDQAKRELLAEKQPSHEFARPGQIGSLTVFLCSEAAAQIRGAALPVDGAWTAQ